MHLLFPRWVLTTAFHTVIKDLFAAVEEKNGGKLTSDQVSRVSLKLGEMLGNPDSHEVIQNEKGQVRHVLSFHSPTRSHQCIRRKLTSMTSISS
jgi:hypothetical protein